MGTMEHPKMQRNDDECASVVSLPVLSLPAQIIPQSVVPPRPYALCNVPVPLNLPMLMQLLKLLTSP